MGELFDIIMYILFAAGIVMTFSAWLSDIRLGDKKFLWYYYLPAAVLSYGFGLLAPHVFVLWLYEITVGSAAMAGLIIIGYPLVIAGAALSFYFIFFRKVHFSRLFYWGLLLTCLFGLSFVTLKLCGI